jgi:nucleoside-diphosphate-sugar epimerase
VSKSILIIGACGQIGTELTTTLRAQHRASNVIATDIRPAPEGLLGDGPFEVLNAMDGQALKKIVDQYQVGTIYHMAALLSAKAEGQPELAWDLNMTSLFHVLNLAKEGHIDKIFWPSSIAVFGPTTPKEQTPQQTVTEPTTVYGISKLAGEGWCSYYQKRYGVDVRTVRYPGLISWKTIPGGGTTDYAIAIYQDALDKGHYNCFLQEDSRMPMMYMEDAVRGTIELMESDNLNNYKAYNLGAISFTPKEQAESIRKYLPRFTMEATPDFRQAIADTWPQSVDDSQAREDWQWNHRYDLDDITKVMLQNLKK